MGPAPDGFYKILLPNFTSSIKYAITYTQTTPDTNNDDMQHKLISIELTGKLLIGSLMIGAGKIKPRKLVTSDEALLELITKCIYRDCAALQTNDPRH